VGEFTSLFALILLGPMSKMLSRLRQINVTCSGKQFQILANERKLSDTRGCHRA
jgi:hypothetical protein